ncbi:MAG: hypothetical protein LQ338_006003 [Usnochroma carphineum]|nr:MAG: hypothetical protein LQ338_006003 [Usnochroma carphineum]
MYLMNVAPTNALAAYVSKESMRYWYVEMNIPMTPNPKKTEATRLDQKDIDGLLVQPIQNKEIGKQGAPASHTRVVPLAEIQGTMDRAKRKPTFTPMKQRPVDPCEKRYISV